MCRRMNLFILALFGCNILNADYYAGINLSLTNLNVKTKLNYPVDSATSKQADFIEGASGAGIKLIGGYTWELLPEKWSMSTELNYDYFSLGTEHNVQNWFLGQNINASNKLHQMFGLFALPTYQLSPQTSIFLGPGLVYGNFSIGYDNSAGDIGVSTNQSSWLSGWALKMGLSTQLTGTWQLNMSYQYTRLTAISITGVEPISADSLMGHYEPIASTVLVGIRYYFVEPSGRPSLPTRLDR